MDEFKECIPIWNLVAKFPDKFKQISILDIGKKDGYTGYIDFIKADDMSEAIMVGVDKHKRQFLAIKVKAKYIGDKEVKITEKNIVGTIFQRYTDDTMSWAYGTCYDLNMIYWDSRLRLCEYNILETRLEKLLKGEKIRNIDYSKFNQSIDYINGNGEWELEL